MKQARSRSPQREIDFPRQEMSAFAKATADARLPGTLPAEALAKAGA
jgi:hypothetical protein